MDECLTVNSAPPKKILPIVEKTMLTALQDPFLPNPFAPDTEECGITRDDMPDTLPDRDSYICQLERACDVKDEEIARLNKHITLQDDQLAKLNHQVQEAALKAEANAKKDRDAAEAKLMSQVRIHSVEQAQKNVMRGVEFIGGNQAGKATHQVEHEIKKRLVADYCIKDIAFDNNYHTNEILLHVLINDGRSHHVAVRHHHSARDAMLKCEQNMRDFLSSQGYVTKSVYAAQHMQSTPTSPGQPPHLIGQSAASQHNSLNRPVEIGREHQSWDGLMNRQQSLFNKS